MKRLKKILHKCGFICVEYMLMNPAFCVMIILGFIDSEYYVNKANFIFFLALSIQFIFIKYRYLH